MRRSFHSRFITKSLVRSFVVTGLKQYYTRPCTQVNSSLTGVNVCHPIVIKKFFSSDSTEGESVSRGTAYLLDRNDVLNRVLEVVKNFEKVDASKVTPDSHFVNDLGLNSLDVVEIVFAIEQEFVLDIPDHDAEKIQSIPDAVEYVAQNPMAK